MLISFHSPFIFYDISVRPWTNSDGFYFRQRSPGGAQPADCVSQPSPLPELWKLLLSPFRRAHYCCWLLRGLFPELLSPFRANSLLSLVGHRVVGMSSMICWREAVDPWKAMGFFLTVLSGAILCWLLCFSYFLSLFCCIFIYINYTYIK